MGEVIPVLFGTSQDPDGTITCSCGQVFTGEDFSERWDLYLIHLQDQHPS